MENKKYYITTPIYYPSANFHIGHCYTTVIADSIARYKKQNGYDVYFLTGSDEHGLKIQRKAEALGITPKEYVDKIIEDAKDLWSSLGIEYDRFIRTTDPDHVEVVQKIFKKLYDKGDIYKGEYKGLYCTPCESFWTESQLVDGKCPDCGREVKKASEEAYFLKLSNYTDRLVEYINSNNFICPESRKNEIVNNFIKPGLQDLCVSRTSFKWGVPVEFDTKHVVYVWIDALSNYITFLGYSPDGNHSEEFKKYWPADVHLIGKDILRFHTIYWPIMLMALDLPLPKKVFGHPWMLFGDDKMSKSKGNIVYADDLVNRFGVDAVRYYMLHEMPYASDGTFTYELLIERINSDLANILGNLVNRTISMSHKYFDGIVRNPKVEEDIDKELKEVVINTFDKVEESMNDLKIVDALDHVFEIFRRSNKYIDETTPWILAKDETKKERLETVLYNLLEAIRCGAVLLQAFLPETAEKIFEELNTDVKTIESIKTFDGIKENTKLNEATPLFMRIDKEKCLEEIFSN